MFFNALPVYRLLKALIISVSIVMTSFYVGLNLRLMCQPETAPCQPSCYSGGQLVYLAVNLVPDWEQTHGVVFRVVLSQCWVWIKKKKKKIPGNFNKTDTLCSVRRASASFRFSLLSGGYGFDCSWDYTKTVLLRFLFLLFYRCQIFHVQKVFIELFILTFAVLFTNRPVTISDFLPVIDNGPFCKYTVFDHTFTWTSV